MSAFLYWLPNYANTTIKHADLVALGLGYAFDNPGSTQIAPLHGTAPGGTGGAIAYDPARTERNGYRPELQTWVKNETTGFWVGMWNDDRPGPEELQRADVLSGDLVKLADQQHWLVPYGRRWSERDDPELWCVSSCVLPRPLSFGGKDEVFMAKPFKRYAHLWAICEADRRFGTPHETEADKHLVDGVGAVFAAVAILQANYVIGTTEIELLEMFSQESPRQILDVFGDWATFRAIVQKKTIIQPASQPSSSGQEADCHVIAQP